MSGRHTKRNSKKKSNNATRRRGIIGTPLSNIRPTLNAYNEAIKEVSNAYEIDKFGKYLKRQARQARQAIQFKNDEEHLGKKIDEEIERERRLNEQRLAEEEKAVRKQLENDEKHLGKKIDRDRKLKRQLNEQQHLNHIIQERTKQENYLTDITQRLIGENEHLNYIIQERTKQENYLTNITQKIIEENERLNYIIQKIIEAEEHLKRITPLNNTNAISLKFNKFKIGPNNK